MRHKRSNCGIHPLTEIVKEEREALGLSMESVEQLAHLYSGQVSEYEKGRSMPKLDAFIKYAEALGFEVQLVRRNV